MMNLYDIYYARSDYQKFLSELGVDEDIIESIVDNKEDQILMPEEVKLIEIGESKIHGLGVFITEDVLTGQLISPVRVSGARTPSGRFTNHSPEPNTIFVPLNGDVYQVAATDILAGEELTVNYRQAMDVNYQSLGLVRPQSNLNLTYYSPTQKAEVLEWILTNNFEDITDDIVYHHIISGGLYFREANLRKGDMVVGKIHNFDHIAMMISGDVTITTDEGLERITGYYRGATKAGLKRVCYAHEDSIWVTVHVLPDPTMTLDNLDQIEDTLFKDSDLSWVDSLNLPSSVTLGDSACQQ